MVHIGIADSSQSLTPLVRLSISDIDARSPQAGMGTDTDTDSSDTDTDTDTNIEADTDVVDPSQPLTAVAFYPSKDRTDACADASVSNEFNRSPVINSGGKIEIHESAGGVFDSVTSNVGELYFSDLELRTSGGNSFQADVLDVVFNTVVFHPGGRLDYGKPNM